MENLETRFEKEVEDKQDKMEKIESLHEKLEDAEQEIENSHELIKKLNAKTLNYELKQAELASLDVALLKAQLLEKIDLFCHSKTRHSRHLKKLNFVSLHYQP